jgi:hypothetical protein
MLERLIGVVCAALLGALTLCLFLAPSYWPPPCRWNEGQQHYQYTTQKHRYSGGANSASFVPNASSDALDAPRDQPETPRERAERLRKSFVDGWTIFIGLCTVLILAVQAWVFFRQAFRLRQTVEAMDAQSKDTKLSIAQANRAAVAMEGVAGSLAESTAITSGMVSNQKEFWRQQMRAYVSVDPGTYFRQKQRLGIFFNFKPNITNHGMTPANKVTIIHNCIITPARVPDDFVFETNWQNATLSSSSTIFPRQTRFTTHIFNRFINLAEVKKQFRGQEHFVLWGTVIYEDIFGDKHHTNYCFGLNIPRIKRTQLIWMEIGRYDDAD